MSVLWDRLATPYRVYSSSMPGVPRKSSWSNITWLVRMNDWMHACHRNIKSKIKIKKFAIFRGDAENKTKQNKKSSKWFCGFFFCQIRIVKCKFGTIRTFEHLWKFALNDLQLPKHSSWLVKSKIALPVDQGPPAVDHWEVEKIDLGGWIHVTMHDSVEIIRI